MEVAESKISYLLKMKRIISLPLIPAPFSLLKWIFYEEYLTYLFHFLHKNKDVKWEVILIFFSILVVQLKELFGWCLTEIVLTKINILNKLKVLN